ncbi:uncharacterized protein LOC106645047 [Copidosoma floridanum]|uniref:uncharacterized protein LOC106645047 n=1 Tax=Copidosoma floridanum TaxID=29053 RepID=UPI000C6F9708|nr:uncharacterized protein LOC106645047 [Copidosoma floridanum]
MLDVRAFRAKNKSKEEEKLTILTQWTEHSIQFFIIREDKSVMVGEMAMSNLSSYAECFNQRLEDYVHETKEIMSGARQNIDFDLKENKFMWKKKSWLRGEVNVQQSTDKDYLLDVFFIYIDSSTEERKKTSEVVKRVASLEKLTEDLKYQLNKCILLKEQMETSLYMMFLEKVNKIKVKNRELRIENNQLRKMLGKGTVYDVTTDESDEEESAKNHLSSQSTVVKKPSEKLLRDTIVRSSFKPSKKKQVTKIIAKSITNIEEEEMKNRENDEKNCTVAEEIQKNDIVIEKNDNINVTESTKDSLNRDKSEKVKDSISFTNESYKMEISQNTCNKEIESIQELKNTNQDVHEKKCQVDTSTIASSKVVVSEIGEDEETPDMLSGESDCEMELRFDDERDDKMDDENEGSNKKNHEKQEQNHENKDEGVDYGKLHGAANNNKQEKSFDSSERSGYNETISDKKIIEQDSEEMV